MWRGLLELGGGSSGSIFYLAHDDSLSAEDVDGVAVVPVQCGDRDGGRKEYECVSRQGGLEKRGKAALLRMGQQRNDDGLENARTLKLFRV